MTRELATQPRFVRRAAFLPWPEGRQDERGEEEVRLNCRVALARMGGCANRFAVSFSPYRKNSIPHIASQ